MRAGSLSSVRLGRADGDWVKEPGDESPSGSDRSGVRRPVGSDPNSWPHPHSLGGGVTVGISEPDGSRSGVQGFGVPPIPSAAAPVSPPLPYDIAGGTPFPEERALTPGCKTASR